MLHTVSCPECRMEFSIATEHVGSKFQCAQCSCHFITKVVTGGFIQAIGERDSLQDVESESVGNHALIPNGGQMGHDHFDTPSRGFGSIFSGASSPLVNPATDAINENEASLDNTEYWQRVIQNSPLSRGGKCQVLDKDMRGLADMLNMSLDEMRSKCQSYDTLSTLSIMELKKILQYFRSTYNVSEGMEVAGKKSNLFERLKLFLEGPTYSHFRQQLCEHTGEKRFDEFGRAYDTADYEDDEGNIVDVCCPGCGVEHQVDGDVIANNTDTHYQCPDCGSLFSVSLPPARDIPEEKEIVSVDTIDPTGSLSLSTMGLQSGTEDLSSGDAASKKSPAAASALHAWEFASIRHLVTLGYSEPLAMRALTLCGGNIQRALLCLHDLDEGQAFQGCSNEIEMEGAVSFGLSIEEVRSAAEASSKPLISFFPNSYLLDSDSGCRPFRQMAELLSSTSNSDSSRSTLWNITLNLLLCEARFLHLFVDVGRMHIVKVIDKLNQAFDRYKKSPQSNDSKTPEPKNVLAVPVPLLQQELHKLRQIMDSARESGGELPAELLEDYVENMAFLSERTDPKPQIRHFANS